MLWDIDIAKRLHHGATAFQLDVRFVSDSPRLVLFGPSGAGKTQTLKILAGIVRPDRGRIAIAGRTLFDGDNGVDLSPQDRRLAYVFQDYALFPHLTVRQNIAFAHHRGWRNPGRHHRDETVERWIGTLHLGAIADHHPHQISGGQRQRTALARALVINPTALLLDEPFAALDRPLRERLREELAELQLSLKIPMMLITHDEDDRRALGDEVICIQSGHLIADPSAALTAS